MTLDCRTCGACCLGSSQAYVGCTLEDAARMPAEYAARVATTSTFRALRMVPSRDGLRCSALLGVPGRRVSCAIYAARPAVCRAVEPDSATCRRSRAELGL